MTYGLKLEITIDGVKKLSRGLEVLRRDRVGNLIPFWRDDALPMLREYQDKVFGAEGAHERMSKWADLTPAYARWKAKHFPGKGILERTGALRQSFQGGTDAIEVVGKDELRYGTRVASAKGFGYPLFHQRHQEKKRPSLRLSMPFRSRLMRKLRDYLSQ